MDIRTFYRSWLDELDEHESLNCLSETKMKWSQVGNDKISLVKSGLE